MSEEHTEKRHHQAEHGGRVLEQNGEGGRVIALSHCPQIPQPPFRLVELTERHRPGGSLEQHGQGEDDVVPRWIGLMFRVLDVLRCFVDGYAAPMSKMSRPQ